MRPEDIPVQWFSLAILATNIVQWVTMVVIYIKGRKK